MDGVFAEDHSVVAEQLVQVLAQALGGTAQVDGVLGLQLTDDLLGEDIVQRLQLLTATAHVHGDVLADLLHDSVTEGDVEVADEVLVQQKTNL